MILKKEIFINFSSYTLYFLPVFLISGPFLSDLAITLVSLYFSIYCILNDKLSEFKKKYFYFFFLFWIYLVLNSIFNNPNLDSLRISITYIRFGILIVAINYIIKNNKKFLQFFFYSLFICFFVLVMDGFYQYFNGKNILGYPIHPSNNRLSSFFGDEFILGSYLSRLFPLLFGLYILNKNILKINLIFIVLIFILSEVLVFLSGERAAFFYINLSAIFLILLIKDYKKLRVASLMISIILIFTISFFNENAKKRVFNQTINQMNLKDHFKDTKKTVSNKQVYIFSKEHNDIYFTAKNIFLDNKFFGIGVKNFREFCKEKKFAISKKSCSTHPHNTYVQLLTETGIVGFLFLFVTFIVFIFYSFCHFIFTFKSKYKFSDYQICLMSCFIISLWPLVPTGNFFNNWLSIIYFFPIGFFIATLDQNKKTT